MFKTSLPKHAYYWEPTHTYTGGEINNEKNNKYLETPAVFCAPTPREKSFPGVTIATRRWRHVVAAATACAIAKRVVVASPSQPTGRERPSAVLITSTPVRGNCFARPNDVTLGKSAENNKTFFLYFDISLPISFIGQNESRTSDHNMMLPGPTTTRSASTDLP